MTPEDFIQLKYHAEWYDVVDMGTAKQWHERNVKACLSAAEWHAQKDRPLYILAVHGSGRSTLASCARELSNSQLLLRGALEQFQGIPEFEVVEIPLKAYQVQHCNNCYATTSALCGFPCIPATERVTTMRGLHSIAAIHRGDVLPSGIVERQWQSSPSAQIYKLSLSDGRELRLTGNHPVKVRRFLHRTSIGKRNGKYLYGRKYEDCWIAAQDLKPTDCIPFPLGGGFAVVKEERLDLAAMAGLIWGAGTTEGKPASRSYCWYVPETEKEHIAAIQTKVPTWVSICSHSYQGMLKVRWSAKVKRELDAWGFDKQSSVPPNIRRLSDRIMLAASEGEVCAFLQGWFSTDGSISDSRISLTNASFHALRDAQLLLQKLGITSSVYRVKGESSFSGGRLYPRAHQLEIHYRPSLLQFAKKIGFSLPLKAERLHAMTQGISNFTNWREPVGRVKSITFDGEEAVYDLLVDKAHEFVAEGIPVHNCNCWPDDPMQELYPLVLKCDALLISTGVNQSAMSSRLKAFLDRLISLDGGFYVAPDQFAPKDGEWKSRCIALSTELSKKKQLPYDARMWGRAAAYFISSKDEANESETVAHDFKSTLNYIEAVAESLRDGNADYGFFHHPTLWYAGAWTNPNEELAYDKRWYAGHMEFSRHAAEVAKAAVNLAKELRGNPPVFDGGGRGKTRT